MNDNEVISAYIESIKNSKFFTKDEERELHSRMLDGKEARRMLIESMLLLAFSEAKRWRRRAEGRGVPFADVVQTANETVIHVVDNLFNPAKGRISTILTPWLTRNISDLLRGRDQTIRVPGYLFANKMRGHRYRAKAELATYGVHALDDVRASLLIDRRLSAEPGEDTADLSVVFERLRTEHHVSERNIKIFKEYARGDSMVGLAVVHGLSKQRISQIVQLVRDKMKLLIKV